MAKATQKQISEITGVSQSIISKVLRGQIPNNMSQSKIDAIHKAAEEIGYSSPGQKPKSAPAQTPKPKPAPRPKFGATPRGDPIHKYGKQWKKRVSDVTGQMPGGNFSDLKHGEQKQVMKILNNIDKGTKSQEKTGKTALALQQKTSRLVWQGVGIGLGAVALPSSVGGMVDWISKLISGTASTGRKAVSLGQDPNQMIASDLVMQKYGAGGKLSGALNSLQQLQLGMTELGDSKLINALTTYAKGANIGKLQSAAYTKDPMMLIDEINKQFQQGGIKKANLGGLMSQLGLSDLTDIITGGNWGEVRGAKAQKGSFKAAKELDEQFNSLTIAAKKLAIDYFPLLVKGIDYIANTLGLSTSNQTANKKVDDYNSLIAQAKKYNDLSMNSRDQGLWNTSKQEGLLVKSLIGQAATIKASMTADDLKLLGQSNASNGNSNKPKNLNINGSVTVNAPGNKGLEGSLNEVVNKAIKDHLSGLVNDTNERMEYL
jgi:transcriptional regulator with XRE-family HTH domain